MRQLKNLHAIGITFLLLPLFACSLKPVPQLHDIWVVKSINGDPVDNMKSPILLEINLKKKIFFVNDGCEEHQAQLHQVRKHSIHFEKIIVSDACKQNGSLSELYTELAKVKAYKHNGLVLSLLNAKNKEVIHLRKGD